MTTTAQTLMGLFGMTDFLVPLVLEDLSEDQARRRARKGEGPSIEWAIGHLLHYRYYVLGMLGVERENPYGDLFSKSASDGADYPALADLQAEWTSVSDALTEALAAQSEEAWNAPGAGAHDEKSLRDQVTFFAWHEGYHMGAVGAMRKELGLLGPAEKVMAQREAEAAG